MQEPALHWSDAGAASWFDVAVAVGELAQRPSYSLLDCSSRRRALGLAPTPWRQALRQLLQALP